MTQRLRYKSLIERFCALVLPPVLLLTVIYFVCLDRIVNRYSVEIELTADNADTLAFYWPNRSGGYEESLSARISYPAGASSQKTHFILASSRDKLRLDPGMLGNAITVHTITFERFGVKEVMSGAEIAANIIESDGLSTSMTEQGIRINFQKGDPKLVLKKHPKPLPHTAALVGLGFAFFCACLLSVLLGKRLLQKEQVVFQTHMVVGSCLLAVFGWMFTWPLYVMLPVGLFFSYAGGHAAIVLVRLKKNRQLFLFVKPLLITGGFLVLLVVPMLMTLSPDTKFVQASSSAVWKILKDGDGEEGRSSIKAAINKYEESFKYRFPFRKDLVNLNATTKIFGLGFSPSPKAIFGRDGMFFEGYGQRRVESDVVGSFDNITDYMGLIPFSQTELEEWLICLEERYYWLQERGIDYVFVLAPTKALVYPENLPSRILKMKEKVNKPTRYKQLVTFLKANSVVPVVDLQTPLQDAKKERGVNGAPDALLYYRTDFHWNYYGSFLAYQAIIDEINRSYPKYDFPVTGLDEFSVHKKKDWVHKAFINALGLDPREHKNETYLTFHPREGSVYNNIGEFAEMGINDYSLPKHLGETFDRHKTRIRMLENRGGQVDSIFVIGDSFAEKYFGYFSGHAEQTINFRTVYSFFPELFTKFSPDLVIQEVLNMYLLQEPPGNPDKIKQARVRALDENDRGTSVALTE